jgi:RNA polymerase sigma-70 factor (ECF subfamily)
VTVAPWLSIHVALTARDDEAPACALDRASLGRIYEEHAPSVRRFLRGLLGSAAAADDGTQETFVRAFRKLATLRDGQRLRPWLLGIARLVAMEACRARKRLVSEVLAPEGEDGCTPESSLLGAEAACRARDALASLSPDRRAALLLRIDHELSYEEIADAMGWSTPKAKIEVHRARVVLRAHLDGDGGAR